jgi:7,8-dihydro-6-hydroxymethylpterin-pyrophosphokinase
MTRRAFVLVPLAEIAPDAVLPTTGQTVAVLAGSVEGSDSVRRLSDMP